jgi:hypothetical protein
MEWVIRQTENNITVDITADGIANHLEYVADGKPRIAGTEPAAKARWVARASWEGKDFVLVSQREDKSLPELNSRFSLSADGKVLSVRRVMGDNDQTWIFEKK